MWISFSQKLRNSYSCNNEPKNWCARWGEGIRQGFDSHSDIFPTAKLYKLCVGNKDL